MKFEREVVQEIWRHRDCTFNVVFPLKGVVCIKGLRGEWTANMSKTMLGALARDGYTKVIWERELGNRRVTKEYELKEEYKQFEGEAFYRIQ